MAKNLALVLAVLLGGMPAAFAETQAQANAKVLSILENQAHVSSHDVSYLAKQLKSTLLYDTAAHLTADATQDDGVVAYAIDSDVYYFRTNGAWTAISSFLTSAMANAETISNAVNGQIKFACLGQTNNEDLTLDCETTSNTVTLTSSTGVTTISSGAIGYKSSSATPLEFTTTSDIGWAVVTGANTACNTTCVHGCVFGFDTATSVLVACSSALADSCLCAGSN